MSMYEILIEASDATGSIWQAMHTETVTTDDTPADLAADVAGNQTIADGDGWRVRIAEVDADGEEAGPWIVERYADGTETRNPEHAYYAAEVAHREMTAAYEAYQAAAAKRGHAFAAVASQSELARRLGISQVQVNSAANRAKAAA